MGLSQDTGVYQKAESKSKISNVKNCVLLRILCSFMSCDGTAIYLSGSIGGSAHFNCLKIFLRERIDIKILKITWTER